MIIENRDDFLSTLDRALQNSQEADFWKHKLIPAARSILSLLWQLKEQDLLFTPEGKPLEVLTLETLTPWFDLVSLKYLAFTLDQSNQASKLLRTKIQEHKANHYQHIDIADIASHLQLYGINLINEMDDFPNRFYVQHFELGEMLKRLLK